jgi:hypothetical protein
MYRRYIAGQDAIGLAYGYSGDPGLCQLAVSSRRFGGMLPTPQCAGTLGVLTRTHKVLRRRGPRRMRPAPECAVVRCRCHAPRQGRCARPLNGNEQLRCRSGRDLLDEEAALSLPQSDACSGMMT